MYESDSKRAAPPRVSENACFKNLPEHAMLRFNLCLHYVMSWDQSSTSSSVRAVGRVERLV